MLVSGKIITLVNDKPDFGEKIQYGFVKVKGMEDDVLFNTLSSFHNTCFENLKIGDKVRISIKKTDQGPFAESLTLSTQTLQEDFPPPPESSL